ncbi:hypothetical protein UT300018_29120 [Clostridium faecium]
MITMNNNDLDKLLKKSLSVNVKPDEKLNDRLKYKLLEQSQKKETSLWWLPMVLSIIFMVMSNLIVDIFVPSKLLKILVFIFGISTITSCTVLTIVGVKKYNLKKGAVI